MEIQFPKIPAGISRWKLEIPRNSIGFPKSGFDSILDFL
jgi:hypothetical protein